MTFIIDGKAQPVVALKLVNGQDVSTLSLPSLTPGTHTFQAFYGGSGAFAASHSSVKTLVVPKSIDAPRITNVWRMGYHTEPTTLILGFNVPLNPTSADNPNAYTIVGPGGQRITILSAVYDRGSKTVTLHPSAQLNLHLTYQLIVSGTGSTALLDVQGSALDGLGNGRAREQLCDLRDDGELDARPAAPPPCRTGSRPDWRRGLQPWTSALFPQDPT